MKKSEKIILISILSLLTILVIFFVVMGFASCQTAYADYDDLNGSEILNFNQLINFDSQSLADINFTSTSSFNITATLNTSRAIAFQNITLYHDHKYYMKSNFINNKFMLRNGTTDVEFVNGNYIFNYSTNDLTINNLYIFSGAIIGNYYLNIIDVSLMFGVGNEPNVEQCENIFTSTYYNYQKGSALTINGIDAYQQGVDSVYNSMHYTLTASHIYNTSYAYEGEKINQTWTYENQTVIATAITDGILAIPLGAVIEQGKTLRIYSGYIGFCLNSPNIDSGLGYLCWACRYNDSFIPIYIGGTAESADNDGYLQFTAPYAMDTIYLLESTTTGYITQPTNRSFGVFNTAVSVVELDASALVDNAYNQGYDSALKTFEPSGSNYLKIYNQGVRDAQTSGSVFQDTWAFMASAFEGIGSMLAVELIPNVPIGLFVAFPLLLGLIFFIVKITKGGD